MNGLRGGLELVASCDASGRMFLRRQAFAPPIHVSKPHRDGGWLVVNLASPSPGLLEGDRVNVRVEVEKEARLLLTAPSANRIHAMSNGHAELNQEFAVAAGAWLDVWPEYLIPQAGARYRQRTRIHVANGGTLLWTETIAPGRTARGEVFAFTELTLATDLFVGDRYALRERYRLTPETAGALRAAFPQGYYASVVCVSQALARFSNVLQTVTEKFVPGTAWLGATQLARDAWAMKIVAADSPTLRRCVASVRAALYEGLACKPAALRRTTGEAVVAA